MRSTALHDVPSLTCLSSGELARLLSVDLKTVHNWVNHGHVVGRRTKGRHLRFRRTEVVRFLREVGFPIPQTVARAAPSVVLVGLGAAGPELLARTVGDDDPDAGLFHALAEAVAGDYEVLAVGSDRYGAADVCCLIRALRRHEATFDVAIVAQASDDAARELLLDAGATLVVETPADAFRGVRFLAGTVETSAPSKSAPSNSAPSKSAPSKSDAPPRSFIRAPAA